MSIKDLTIDIKDSLLRAPTWVAVWMAIVLLPVNVASLFFLEQPLGILVAVLSIGGILPNAALLVQHRGFTSAMGVPHTIAWIPLLVVCLIALLGSGSGEASGAYVGYLIVLIAVNGFSLVFDVPDTVKYFKGDVSTY